MMVTPGNGEHTHDDTSSAELLMLEEMYNRASPSYIKDLICEPERCENVAMWKVVWDADVCVCMPDTVCDLGKILIEEAMEILDRLRCNNCGAPIVPALILPLYSKGRFL